MIFSSLLVDLSCISLGATPLVSLTNDSTTGEEDLLLCDRASTAISSSQANTSDIRWQAW